MDEERTQVAPDDETLERATELAWSAETDTDPAEQVRHRDVWTVATAILLSGIAIAGIILIALIGGHRAPDTGWPQNGLPPVSVTSLPAPDSPGTPDHSIIMAGLDRQAGTLDAAARKVATDNAEFLELLRPIWTVTDEAKAIQWGHNVCTTLGSPPYPRTYQVSESVAEQSGTSFDTAAGMVAAAVVVFCPQYQ